MKPINAHPQIESKLTVRKKQNDIFFSAKQRAFSNPNACKS